MRIDLQILRVAQISREHVLQPGLQKSIGRVPLVTTYHPTLTRLACISKKHLHTSEKLKRAISNPPLIVFRRHQDLRDLLVWHTPAHPLMQEIICNSPRCKTCHILSIATVFKSNITGRSYKIRAHISCKPRISCKKCSIQCIGGW